MAGKSVKMTLRVMANDPEQPALPVPADWSVERASLDRPAAKCIADLLLICLDPADEALSAWLHDFRQSHPHCPVFLAETATNPSWFRAALNLHADRLVSWPLEEGKWLALLKEIGEALQAGREQTRLLGRLERSGQDLEKSRERLAEVLLHSYENLEALNEQLTNRVGQLSTLYQLGRDLSSEANWDRALDHFLSTSVSTLDFRGVTLLLWSFEGKRLAPRASLLLEDDLVEGCIALLKEETEERRLATGIFAVDNGKLVEDTELLHRQESWQLTVVPLVHGGEAQGYILYRKEYSTAEAFDADFHFLKTVQTILSEEIANAKAVHRLKKLGDFNRTVLESMRAAVLALDGKGRVAYRNSQAIDLFGERLTVGHAFSFTTGLRPLDSDLDPPGEKDWIQRECLYQAGGAERHLLLSSTELQVRHETDTRHVLIFEDLTEYKQLESELRRAERLAGLGQLSAGVAHEIRNPLSGISMMTQLLVEHVDDDTGREYINRILSETERLNRIVQSMLDISRPAKPELAPVSLAAQVLTVMELLQSRAEEKEVVLQSAAGAGETIVWADPDHLQQVLLNLIGNAIEACGRGDEVGVKISALPVGTDADDRVTVTVWDSGPGVPDGSRSDLFNPFFTTRAEGTGLGLSICLKIIEEHGGTIRYEDRVGGGAEFTFDLAPAPAPIPSEELPT